MTDTLTGALLAHHRHIMSVLTQATQRFATVKAELQYAHRLSAGWAAVLVETHDMGPQDTITADGRIVRAPTPQAEPAP